jgi:hypothetical protein
VLRNSVGISGQRVPKYQRRRRKGIPTTARKEEGGITGTQVPFARRGKRLTSTAKWKGSNQNRPKGEGERERAVKGNEPENSKEKEEKEKDKIGSKNRPC